MHENTCMAPNNLCGFTNTHTHPLCFLASFWLAGSGRCKPACDHTEARNHLEVISLGSIARDQTCPGRTLSSMLVLSQSSPSSCEESQVHGCGTGLLSSSSGWFVSCSGPSQWHRAGRSGQRTLHVICRASS